MNSIKYCEGDLSAKPAGVVANIKQKTVGGWSACFAVAVPAKPLLHLFQGRSC